LPEFTAEIISGRTTIDGNLRYGTVEAVDEDAVTLDVRVNGRLLVGIRHMASYSPVVGDFTGLIRQQATWLAIGPVGGSTVPPDFEESAHTVLASGTTTSASFGDIPGGGSLVYVKKSSTSKFILRMEQSWFASGAQAGLAIGLSVSYDGTGTFATVDVEVVRYPITNAALGAWDFVVGGAPAAIGGPVGPYTFVPRWLRVNGTGTCTVNTDARLSYYVKEVRA
jgi:hypothetical protein